MSTWNMMTFQDSNSFYSDNLISFHNLTMMMMIISLTTFFIMDFMYNNFLNLTLLKNHTIEIIWTLTPMIILMIICFPSLKIF